MYRTIILPIVLYGCETWSLTLREERRLSMQVESGLQSALNRHTVRPFTESDDTRGCNNTICPPEDEQGTARNMLRIIM